MIIPNRDNSGINYPQGYPGSRFSVVIYTILKNRGSESYRKKPFGYLGGAEQLCFLFFLRRLNNFETSVKEKVVDDLEATGNDEGKAQQG